jgi:hypothetical protein
MMTGFTTRYLVAVALMMAVAFGGAMSKARTSR